jgi:signal transduction histidine kinase
LPLVTRDQTHGGIGLYYEQKRHFTEEDVKLAEMFAHQAALAIENARLRARLEQAAVAAERHRIARDLHDSVTQTLFSANLIAEVLPRLWERDPAEARRRMEEMRQLTRGALAEMRMLLLELRPATLSIVPLGDLLKQLADAAGGRSCIPVTVTMDGDDAHLPLQAHNTLYRIAQEALNNIAKHSGATHAEVSLDCDGNRIEMKIIDNGKGFDSTALGSSDHLGLNIMRERAQEIGAELKVESEPGRGTCVLVEWQAVA